MKQSLPHPAPTPTPGCFPSFSLPLLEFAFFFLQPLSSQTPRLSLLPWPRVTHACAARPTTLEAEAECAWIGEDTIWEDPDRSCFFLFLNAVPSSRPMGKHLRWRVPCMGGSLAAGTDRGAQEAPAAVACPSLPRPLRWSPALRLKTSARTSQPGCSSSPQKDSASLSKLQTRWVMGHWLPIGLLLVCLLEHLLGL